MSRKLIIALALAMALPGGLAWAETGIMTGDSSLGKVLTDANGMTLYTFDKDGTGSSACNGDCATNWPPLTAPEGAQAEDDYTLVKRDDGTMQWAYYGKPLYLYAGDKAAGDVTGDGLNGVWHAAKAEE